MNESKSGELHVRAGETVREAGESPDYIYTVLSGWAIQSIALQDGRRQILRFLLPGDSVGLSALGGERATYSVEALSDAVVCLLRADVMMRAIEQGDPLVSELMTALAQKSFSLDLLALSLGQRTAPEKIAYVISDLHHRASAVELATRNSFVFPAKQHHLADAIGLSLIHTNRSLQRLEAQNILSWSRNTVSILDHERLAALSRFEPYARKQVLF